MKNKLGKTQKQMWMPQGDIDGSPMQLAHAYVPWQYYDAAFSPQEALMKGTLFPELYGVYMPPR
ncbi:spore coat associated protein CotJA [Pelosinus sp. sgz500959]|uniref:spore coat associated protein CotJA n=1 Tax=Pelosinus sp. sgz500959 TaxID=3242472 RepID=UPI00366D1295